MPPTKQKLASTNRAFKLKRKIAAEIVAKNGMIANDLVIFNLCEEDLMQKTVFIQLGLSMALYSVHTRQFKQIKVLKIAKSFTKFSTKMFLKKSIVYSGDI